MEDPDPLRYKHAIASVFSRTSETHDSVGTPMFAHLGSALVGHLVLRPGDRVLDVAAGAGATLLPAAERVGDEGLVIGVDLAPGMARRLRTEIAAARIANAGVAVGDADALPFADETFDAVLCGFALFFFPDPDRALGEFRRVLRPGGALGLSTFTTEAEASLERIRQHILAHLPDRPAPQTKIEFDEPPQLHEALGRAGFADGKVTIAPLELVIPGSDALWGWLWTMEFRDDLERMDHGTRAALRRSLAADLLPAEGGSDIRLRMDALLTRARKPGAASQR